ncbi:MAG: secretin N-terminal domain-containing protein [Dialister micraerophilus]|uniref:type II secretion system protein GspD n=1 Tax=Dialister micraerophilus TaxID=309120 RepID=UPI00254E4F08|nr:secretin N-terminal domain-containing protein [Dialister micraerophilus]MDK8253335.1 secretin N-terminal domain-containing protein [Dialister micraerophilus]
MKHKILCLGSAILLTVCTNFFVEASDNFSLHVQNAPLQQVLQSLAELSGKNVVIPGDLKGTVTASIDNVTPEEALNSLLLMNELIIKNEGSTMIIYNAKSESDSAKTIKTFKLSYGKSNEIANELKNLTDNVQVASDVGTNSVIVNATPRAMSELEYIIKALDIPEKQVKVEAEVLAVNRSYAKDLGIEWQFKSLTGQAEQRNVYDKSSKTKTSYLKIPEDYAGISYGKSITGNPYTFFFQAKLNALLSNGKAKILAKPNVVTLNGRTAEILIGSKIPVLVEHMENGTKTTSIEYKDAGIKLTYTPNVSKNSEITADIIAEVSTPYLVPEMKAYRIVTRQAHTTVRLKSGDMLTIGGLIDKEEANNIRKVPVLGDIPILGKLFQTETESKEESEIIIIIRANILE